MQNTTADYKLEINKPSRSFESKITIGNNIYTNEDLVNLTLEYAQPQEGFAIGNTISQSLDLTLLNRGDIIYSTSQIKVEIGLKIGSTIEYILMGIFNIDDIEKTDYTTKITAYDNMIKFETPYFSSLGDKPTLKQVVNELSKITGIEFIGSLPDYNVSKLEGFTCREVLSYVASICGGNAFITRDGKFTIKSLSEVEKSIDGNNYFDYTREEVKYKVGQISCQVDENNILSKGSVGTDSMELGFENPWITETILTEIYNKLKSVEYLGYSMKWQGDISLDPYDIITVTDIKNVVRKIPILSQKLSYTGGLTSEIGAKGETKNKNSFSSSGSTTNKVNRAVIEQAIIKEALIGKANIENVEAVSIRTQTLEAKTAKLEEAIIDVAYVSDLTAINANIQTLFANDATINNALIGKADITELNAVQGNITSLNSQVANIQTLVNGNLSSENIQTGGITSDKLTIADGFITNAMIANLDVSKINAGDISTNKFRIVSDSGKMLISDNTIQISDNNRVRVQIGKDASNDYNMYVWDSAGKLMFDATGLKADGIKNKIIRDDMISDTANIAGSKINISSLITEINKDTNTSVIKSSKVQLDTVGQTLEVAFNSLKSNVDNIQVGGRNLLTKDFMESGNLSGVDGSVIGGTYIAFYRTKNFIDIENNSKYVLKINKYDLDDRVEKIIAYTSTNAYISTHTINSTETIFIPPANCKKIKFVVIVNNANTSYIVEEFKIKLEKGNKPTDWTPAPEDVDSEIESVKQITESNSTTINVMQGQIATAINNTQIVKDGQTVLLKDDYNRTVALVDSINSTIGTHTTKINELTGSITSVDTKVNSVQRDLEGTKSTVSSHSTSISDLSSKVSTQGSSISQLQNQIALKVEATDITNAINNVQIGGRNLLINSDNGYLSDLKVYNNSDVSYSDVAGWRRMTFTNQLNNEIVHSKWYTPVQLGDYTFSIMCRTDATSFSSNVSVFTNEKGHKNIPANIVNLGDSLYKIVATFTISDFYKIRVVDLTSFNTVGATYVEFRYPMLEVGNKSSSWCPAVEDVDSSIENVQTQVTTTSNKVATIETNLNSITQRVNSTESTISTHTNQLSTVDNKIDTAKKSAISTAESDATSKANNALTNAKSYTDGQITTVNQTITNKVADIKLTTDSITQRVSSTESSLSSTTTIANNANSKIDGLTIGGRNLLLKSDIDKYGLGYWGNNGDGLGSIEGTYVDGTKTIKVVGSSGIIYNSFIKLKRNTTYTYSMMMKSSGAMIINGSNPLHMWVNTVESANHLEIIISTSVSISANIWTKVWIVFKTPNEQDIYYMKPFIYGIASNTVHISKIKIEEGNKATDWTPAPEDIDSAISTVDSKITTTSNKVATIETNLSSITSRVSSTESSITTINGNITSLQSRMNTAEQKITDSAIINTVKETINTAKNEAINSANSSTDNKLKSYATTSSLTQTANSITASFKSSGGFNLLKNSDAKNGTAYWLNNGGGLSITTAGANPFNGEKEFKTSFPSGMRYSEDIRLKANTDYVYEAWIYTNTAITSSSITPLHFWCSSEAGVSGQSQCTVIDYRQTLTVNAYTKVYVHFKTKSGNVFFRPFIYSSATAGMICVKQISLSESTLESAWTPHPDEVYSGSTIIDASGVTINNGALTVKNKSGTTVLSGDTNGNLIFAGTAKSQSGDRFVGLDSGGVTFQDSQRNEQMLRAAISYFESNRDMNGVNFALAQYGDFIRFSHIAKADLTNGWTSSDTQYNFMDFWSGDQTVGGVSYKKGINVYAPMYINNGIKLYSGTTTLSEISGGVSWNNGTGTLSGLLGLYGDNGAVLGYKSGENLQARFIVSEAAHPGTGDNLISFGNYNFNGYTFHNANIVAKSLSVSGSKNCLQETKSYGERLINAYETAEYFFGDLGFARINEDGECLVSIDDTFLECVNTDIEYHVFTQIYNKGAIDTIERYKTYFIVKGDPGTKFSWELKAKRIGYENNRLDTQDIEPQGENKVELFGYEDFKVETSEDTLMNVLTFELEDLLLMEG